MSMREKIPVWKKVNLSIEEAAAYSNLAGRILLQKYGILYIIEVETTPEERYLCCRSNSCKSLFRAKRLPLSVRASATSAAFSSLSRCV